MADSREAIILQGYEVTSAVTTEQSIISQGYDFILGGPIKWPKMWHLWRKPGSESAMHRNSLTMQRNLASGSITRTQPSGTTTRTTPKITIRRRG